MQDCEDPLKAVPVARIRAGAAFIGLLYSFVITGHGSQFLRMRTGATLYSAVHSAPPDFHRDHLPILYR
jgi:hypothetical protein